MVASRACASGIQRFEVLGGFILSPGLQGIIPFFGSDRDRPTHMTNRLGTEPQTRADLTIFGGEFDLNDLVGSVIESRGPAEAFVPLWASSLLVFPIDEKT